MLNYLLELGGVLGAAAILGSATLAAGSACPLSAEKRKMTVGESASAMFTGDWAFASIPSGAFFLWELMVEWGLAGTYHTLIVCFYVL